MNSRIEDYRPETKFATLAARAFSSLWDLVRLSKENLTSGTRILALKGKYPAEEIETLQSRLANDQTISDLNKLRPEISVKKLDVPFVEADRHLVIIDFK